MNENIEPVITDVCVDPKMEFGTIRYYDWPGFRVTMIGAPNNKPPRESEIKSAKLAYKNFLNEREYRAKQS